MSGLGSSPTAPGVTCGGSDGGRSTRFRLGTSFTYDATQNRWANVPLPGSLLNPLTRTGPLARGHTMVYDPVNKRIVILGTTVLTSAENRYTERGGDDVWAYEVASNTWTEVVPSRQ